MTVDHQVVALLSDERRNEDLIGVLVAPHHAGRRWTLTLAHEVDSGVEGERLNMEGVGAALGWREGVDVLGGAAADIGDKAAEATGHLAGIQSTGGVLGGVEGNPGDHDGALAGLARRHDLTLVEEGADVTDIALAADAATAVVPALLAGTVRHAAAQAIVPCVETAT